MASALVSSRDRAARGSKPGQFSQSPHALGFAGVEQLEPRLLLEGALADYAGPRVTSNLQAFYDFEEQQGTIIRDTSGVGKAIDFKITDTAAVSWKPGALSIDSSTLIKSEHIASQLVSALQATNEVTIEAWIKPANTTQSGPARIVTLGSTVLRRNLLLGQTGTSYNVRLRTTATDLNGNPTISTPMGEIDGSLNHVVFTRASDGSFAFYVDNQLVESGTRGGNFSNWSTVYNLALANEMSGDRPWLGEYHLLAFYDKALSAAEVAQNYSAGADPGVDAAAPQIDNINVTKGEDFFQVDFNTNENATVYVQYGQTDAYELGAVQGPATAGLTHSLRVNGLLSDTVYHYRLVATDAVGNVFTGPDTQVTTDAIVVPPGIVSDDFNDTQIDTDLWQFVDPLGDCSAGVNGYQLLLNVAAGKAHDLWTGGNKTARLMQTAPDEDFEVEVKFESLPAGSYASQGVVVEGANGKTLRFEFFSAGAKLYVYAATLDGSTAVKKFQTEITASQPLYMKITRAGDHWTQKWSQDGTTWYNGGSFDFDMAVQSVGPYAGNTGTTSTNAPAFTAVVDYFFNTASPIVPEDGNGGVDTVPPQISDIVVTPSQYYIQVDFKTNEPAAVAVKYGKTAAYELGTVNGGAIGLNHSVRIEGLTLGTAYKLQIVATDGAANVATSANIDTATVSSNGIVSDDFSNGLNSSLWRTIDPLGDCAFSTDGQNLSISIPAGVSHDIWASEFNSPILVQNAADADFEIEAKFVSMPVGTYAGGGLYIEGTGNEFLRFDFYSYLTDKFYMFAASQDDNVPKTLLNRSITPGMPLWLKANRTGDHWDFDYSYNGTDWIDGVAFDYDIAVTGVGLFAGTAEPDLPAYNCLVDYFFNNASRIDPEDGSGSTNVPPTIGDIQVTPGDTFVQVDFSTNEATTAYVKFGQTTAYEMGQVASAVTGNNHSVRIEGLAVGQTYQLQIVATDLQGAPNTSANLTTTTQAVLGGSDQFNGTTLNTALWQFVDPTGTSSLSFDGNHALISVAGGSSHDIWGAENKAPRLLQQVSDADHTFEAKFDSAPTGTYAINGIVLQGADGKLIRFDFFSAGTTLYVFAATQTGTTSVKKFQTAITPAASLYLRVVRTGDHWSQLYSTNGTTWVQGASFDFAMTLQSAGPYAGNAGGSAPAYTAAVDYFLV